MAQETVLKFRASNNAANEYVQATDDAGGGPLPVAQSAEKFAEAIDGGNSAVIGTSSVTIVDANESRRDMIVWNRHATAKVSIVLGDTAASPNGGQINPGGGSAAIPLGYTGPVSVISDTASTTVSWWEA
jgi:hypothetical protein